MLYKVNQAEKTFLLTPKPTPDGMANDRMENLTMLAKQIDLEEYISYLDEQSIKPTQTMPYQLVTYPTMTTRKVLDTFPNYAAAKRAAEQRYLISYYEQDTDVTYVAADFITEQGAIYSIEPAKADGVTNNVSKGDAA